MGLLSEGSPLSWEETKALAEHVRSHGIQQFINLYYNLEDRQGDVLKWGDEVEYILVHVDHKKKEVRISLRAKEILDVLRQHEVENPNGVQSLWRPEYGAYMVEGTPGKPYGGLLAHFNVVEANMKRRREEVRALLHPDELLFTITNFPRLGCGDFTWPSSFPKPNSEMSAARSLFFPDEAIFPGHPRFKTLTRNIRHRRGEKVVINMPIYEDVNTPKPFIEDLAALGDEEGQSQSVAKPDHIYMDAMGFGMGCCCLQLTFQACNIEEARVLYDQLTPLCPIMLALTAGTPIFRGMLSNVDCRWNVIASSVDCRTKGERGEEELKEGERRIYKSRYDSIDSYISATGERYNDIPLVYDKGYFDQLTRAGIDPLLARHVAHLFIRDPISLFSEKVHQDDTKDSDHFENIQSTNWQTMRFKPPPPNSTIGWRVEFRPCEVQLTDFENAAIVCFVVLLTRVVISHKLSFLIPISKVDENMQNAQKRDAVLTEKFWFRKSLLTDRSPPEASTCFQRVGEDEEVLMSINEIINGKDGCFPGLIPLIHGYLSGMEVDADTHCTVQRYLGIIQRRASGEVKTTARWIRDYVLGHPQYKQDSVVSSDIAYDLLMTADGIQQGTVTVPNLLGPHTSSKTTETIPLLVSETCCNGD